MPAEIGPNPFGELEWEEHLPAARALAETREMDRAAREQAAREQRQREEELRELLRQAGSTASAAAVSAALAGINSVAEQISLYRDEDERRLPGEGVPDEMRQGGERRLSQRAKSAARAVADGARGVAAWAAARRSTADEHAAAHLQWARLSGARAELALLGLPMTEPRTTPLTAQELRGAWHSRSQEWHPDLRGPHADGGASSPTEDEAEAMYRINAAYEMLRLLL